MRQDIAHEVDAVACQVVPGTGVTAASGDAVSQQIRKRIDAVFG